MQVERFTDRRFDVIVVGGGPAGASVAIRLAGAGARVGLLEQKKFPREKLCGEFISPECLEHFARLGVAGSMGAAGGARLRETVFYAASGRAVAVPSQWFARGVAQSSSGIAQSSRARDGGDASTTEPGVVSLSCALGLSRAEMDARLLARAREVGAEVFEEAHAADVVSERGRVVGVRARASGEETTLRAPLTVDATGRARTLARRIERAKHDDQNHTGPSERKGRRHELVAFKAHLSGARVAEGACEIYFYRGGYGGLSSVERGLSNLCFIVAARDVRARASDAERVLREVVASNRRAAETLREARVESAWLAVALEGFGRFRVAPAPGLIAVGDAASFIDPFTGSGMLMALESGELAAAVATRHLSNLRAHDARRDQLRRDGERPETDAERLETDGERLETDGDRPGSKGDGLASSSDDLASDDLASSEDYLASSSDGVASSGDCLGALAAEYRALYRERFGARLRVCSYLRRAAFAPAGLVELGVAALSASALARRALARATRGGSHGLSSEEAQPDRPVT